MGGLGYQEYVNGAWQTVDAMTADGAIVANRITTGSLYADRIRGGTLHLGHTEILNPDGTGSGVYTDGYIDVKDNNNKTILEVDKTNGMTVNNSNDNQWIRTGYGMILGGVSGSDTFQDGPNNSVWCTARINFNAGYSGAPKGLDIRTQTLGLNIGSLWVSSGFDGPAHVGQSLSFTVDGYEYEFINGILCEKRQVQGGD